MSVYARFKRDHDGFRKLVELLESTAPSRRQKMIDVGMAEDAEYTKKALEYVMDFNDVLKLPDLELAEVCAKARPEMIAYSLNGKEKTVIDRFLGCCPAKTAIQVRD
jgi:flagellar motor switch protein FliG